MSKVGQWILGMEEDAAVMTAEEFVKLHGDSCLDVWNRVNGPDDSFWELDEPCDKVYAFGFYGS